MSSTSSIKPGAPSAHYSARAMAERSMAIAPSITDVIEAVGPDFDDSSGEFDPTDIDLQSEAWQSIDSSVYRHHYENGRRYHKYRYGRYPIPNDDQEQNRDDWKHAMHMELTDGKIFFAPLGDYPQKIADLGTGTGSWAIEMADKFPSAEVIGTDLSPIQPTWVPPNLRFVVDDLEDEWVLGDNFDYIHLRHVTPMLKDVPKLLRQSIHHMRPGGWIEIQEFAGHIRSDDDSLRGSELVRFWDKTSEALELIGFQYRIAESEMGRLLARAGYTNITVRSIKVPIGTWPRNKTLRLCGMYMRANISNYTLAIATKPLRKLGLSLEEAQTFAARAVEDMDRPGAHPYLEFQFWLGQKPVG